jgi:hypothetical protein
MGQLVASIPHLQKKEISIFQFCDKHSVELVELNSAEIYHVHCLWHSFDVLLNRNPACERNLMFH